MSSEFEKIIPFDTAAVRELGRKVLSSFQLWFFIILVIVGGWTAIYTVDTESQAVILRFGKHIKTVDPGLHFKIPFGIDKSIDVPVKRQLKQEFGFSTPGAVNPFQSSFTVAEQELERSMVTGDLNASLVEWVVQYRIEDPEQYLFRVRTPDATLRDASESVMREVVGDRTVDEVITIGRQEIESEALEKLQKVVISYEMGIKIDQVQLKNVNPPLKVQASFNEVNAAQQERESAINEANGEYNKIIPRAKGEADQQISGAEGYATKRVNEAEGDAHAFNALLAEYTKSAAITKRRIYLETMSEILPQFGRKIIIDEDTKGLLPLLNLEGGAAR